MMKTYRTFLTQWKQHTLKKGSLQNLLNICNGNKVKHALTDAEVENIKSIYSYEVLNRGWWLSEPHMKEIISKLRRCIYTEYNKKIRKECPLSIMERLIVHEPMGVAFMGFLATQEAFGVSHKVISNDVGEVTYAPVYRVFHIDSDRAFDFCFINNEIKRLCMVNHLGKLLNSFIEEEELIVGRHQKVL